MKFCNNILETIGNTPLIKLNRITDEVDALVLAKVEYFNPGSSVKDRMALKMVEDAEKDGRLKPGGTIVEGTSGNTGMGLALAAIVKGYKLICVSTDKQSKEKFDILRAVGADVIVCPTNVEPEDPRSYYSTSKRISEETENSWYVNQYDNPSNTEAHYLSTGPEIWDQTDGKITHFVVGVGTGGTITGVAKRLKKYCEQSSVSSLGLPPAPTEYVDSLYEILKCTGLTTVRLRFTLYLLTSLVYYKFIINYTKVVKIQTQVRRSDYYQTQLRHR